MTVRELTEALSLTPFHLAQPDRPVSGGYAGDLLSWVLGRAGQDTFDTAARLSGAMAAG